MDELSKFFELHNQLDERTTAIRNAREVGDVLHVARFLLERAHIEMGLRDLCHSLWSHDPVRAQTWQKFMDDDIALAHQAVEA